MLRIHAVTVHWKKFETENGVGGDDCSLDDKRDYAKEKNSLIGLGFFLDEADWTGR